MPKFDRFCEIPEMYRRTRIQCMKDFTNLIPHVEEMIRFQYWFNEKMFPIVNKTLGLREQVDKKLDISCSLFSRNIQLSYASYMSCFNGITTAAYNLLRTVYESILAQYYVGSL